MAHLPHVNTGIAWYANYPHHYAGDATHATPEKGNFLLERLAQRLAAIIRAVKEDSVTPALTAEFYQRADRRS